MKSRKDEEKEGWREGEKDERETKRMKDVDEKGMRGGRIGEEEGQKNEGTERRRDGEVKGWRERREWRVGRMKSEVSMK